MQDTHFKEIERFICKRRKQRLVEIKVAVGFVGAKLLINL